ncbi:MAG: hypothetical protein CSA66_03645 [Proteobacteria bacterium]|nr:MAG: hypothetical protein CSA66_03645 [Pseudomonadota bacterium]
MLLPRLTEQAPLHDATRAFLAALPAAGFEGDVSADLATRLVTATDNSVYQIMPQAVVYPRHHDDVATLFRLGAEPRFARLTFAPRGGGTGTNAQSLSTGVIVDVSRHMNRILELDLTAGLVRVQPGVVLDQLNDFLRPHGVFFAPHVSPSSRATIGGMISTDASGKGSRVYGKTGRHVQGLEAVLVDGTPLRVAPMDDAALAAACARDDAVGHVHRELVRVLDDAQDDIARDWPKLTRYLTGYNLAQVRDRERGLFDLAMLIAGAEGTLATITEATLRVTPIPDARTLLVLKYGAFEDALASAGLLVASDPSAIETIDETVLDLARDDVIYDGPVRGYIDDAPGAPATRTINLVEFEGPDPVAIKTKVDTLLTDLERAAGQPGAPHAWRVAESAADRAALWELRKKGVGLLGARKSDRKPVAFIEDTVVPPERLPAYVAELRALLEAEGLYYGMFGHVDVGCLHVRPALDLRDPEDEARLRRVSDATATLVKKHGGLIWGEHGKGVRSEYSPAFFGERLFGALCEVKGAFDPEGRLNPGKVATPPGRRAELASIDAPTRGAADRQISPAGQERFAPSLSCNGNGACFDYHPDHVMCPSSKVTRDRRHSPKGRAGLLREWLRQLSRAGFDPGQGTRWGRLQGWLSLPARLWHSATARLCWDLSREVHQAMDGCLACKACATACPIKVDVPAMRAEFTELYHRRYLRPAKDHFVAALEGLLPIMGRLALPTNLLLKRSLVQWLIGRAVGIVDTPALARPGIKRLLAQRGGRVWSVEELLALPTGLPEDAVIFVQDAFTTFYEPHVVVAAWELARRLGRTPYLLAFFPNGKGLHVRGFLRRFERLVADNAATLERLAPLGRPLIGIDPAVTLTYRDEYARALGRPLAVEVQLLQQWLVPALAERGLAAAPASGRPLHREDGAVEGRGAMGGGLCRRRRDPVARPRRLLRHERLLRPRSRPRRGVPRDLRSELGPLAARRRRRRGAPPRAGDGLLLPQPDKADPGLVAAPPGRGAGRPHRLIVRPKVTWTPEPGMWRSSRVVAGAGFA